MEEEEIYMRMPIGNSPVEEEQIKRIYPSKTKSYFWEIPKPCYTPLWHHSAFPAKLMIISFLHFLLLEQIQQQR